MRFGKTHFPWQARELHAGLRAGARTADTAGDEDDVRLGFRHTGGHRADAGLGDELHADRASGLICFRS